MNQEGEKQFNKKLAKIPIQNQSFVHNKEYQ